MAGPTVAGPRTSTRKSSSRGSIAITSSHFAVGDYPLLEFVLSISPSDRNVRRGFGVFDVLLITLVAWLWGRIAQQLTSAHAANGWGSLAFSSITLFSNTASTAASLPTFAVRHRHGHAVVLSGWPDIILARSSSPALDLAHGHLHRPLLLVFPRERDADRHAAPVRPRWNLVVASVLTTLVFVGIRLVLRRSRGGYYAGQSDLSHAGSGRP